MPGNVFFGGGIWMADNPALTRIREAIVYDSDGWRGATQRRAFKARFGTVAGEGLKRPPKGFDPDHPLIEDLKRKSLFAMQHVVPKATYDASFSKEVGRAFATMAPMMEFLTSALGLSFSLDD